MSAHMRAAVTVCAASPAQLAQAGAYAARLDIPLDDPSAGFALVVTASGLQLRDRAVPQKPLVIDFVKLLRERGTATLKSPLGRASGIRRSVPVAVLDCTGGLGRDACMLASLGAASVTIVERHPVLALLLEDALERARAHATTMKMLADVRVCCDDANNLITDTEGHFDLVFVDPMFPQARRALAGRELQILQRLLGDDAGAGDADTLIAAALASGCRRVVVKRARVQSAAGTPTYVVKGRSFRFDVYVNPAASV